MASESDKIKYSDFAEEGAIQKLVNDLKEAGTFLKEFEKTWLSIKDSLKSNARESGKSITGIDTSTIEGVKKLDAELNKYRYTVKTVTDIEKTLIYEKEKNRIAVKNQTDAIKANAAVQNAARGSINEMRAELKAITLQWNALSGEEMSNIDVGGKLSKQKLELTNKLKNLEGATGDHRREVGNYGNALKGMNAILIATAESFGFNKELIDKLKESYGILKHATHGAHAVMHEVTGEHHAGAEASKAHAAAEAELTVVTEGTTTAMKALKYALVATGIGAFVALIYLAYTAFESYNEETRLTEESTKRLAKLNQELAESYAKLNEEVYKAGIRELETIKKVLEARMAANGVTKHAISEIGKVQAEIDAKEIADAKQKITVNEKVQEAYADRIVEIEKEKQKNLKKLTETSSSTDVFGHVQSGGVSDLERHKIDAENAKLDADLAQWKLFISNKKIEAVKLNSDLNALEGQQLVDSIHLNKELADVDKEKNSKMLDALKKRLEEMKRLQLEEKLELQKLADQKAIDDEKEIMDGMIKWQAIGDAEEEEAERLRLFRKEQHKQRMQEELDRQKELVAIFQKEYDQRYAMEKNAGDYRISLLDSEITQQAALAQTANANHLDEAIRAKAEAIAAQKELDKKAFREKEFQQLASIYLEYTQELIKTGSKDAAAQALVKTLEAEAIAKGLSYAYAEEGGILGDNLKTDYKLFSKKHKTGDVLVQATPGEAFISLQDMEGLRQGIVPEFLKKVWNPGKDGMINHSMTSSLELNQLRSEIQEFTKAIKERPAISIQKDLYGNLILAKSENGRYKNYIQAPNSPIVERDLWH